MAALPTTTRPRVLFVTTGLDTGGAEKMLARLLARLHGRDIEAGVVSLLGNGPVSGEIEALGVCVWHLGLDNPWRLPLATARLAMLARRFQPDVIQGWMYHGNLAAWMARIACGGRPRLMWGIRQSLYDLALEKPDTRRVIRLGMLLSGSADAIVYNSETSRQQHEVFGFSAAHSRIIDNGFDTDLFQPDPSAHFSVCAELNIGPESQLIGLVARHHPVKGHEVFLEAATILAAYVPQVHFVLVGRNVCPGNPSFLPWLANPVLCSRTHLLSERQDIPRLTAAFDVATSSSWGEAFPNAVGEAMCCAVPCVATAVGDVTRMLGDTGTAVSPGDATALAEAWDRLLSMPGPARVAMGQAARQRVIKCFSLDQMATCYAELYRNAAAPRASESSGKHGGV